MGKLLKAAALVGIAVVLAGIIYEQVGRSRDRSRLAQIGLSVDIGGRRLNINCLGEGGPPVIFESGLNAPGLMWADIQAAISSVTRACWYDRAGLGWSDPGPLPRTSYEHANDLHLLLRASGIKPPYVLVGHSFGGFDIRVYNGLYPDEVAGVVLVDASQEEEPQRAPAFARGVVTPEYLRPAAHLLIRALVRLGVVRLMQPKPPAHAPSSRFEMIRELRRRPDAQAAEWSAGMMWDTSAAQAHAAGSFHDRPLLVLTAGRAFEMPDPALAKAAAAYHEVWMHELQPKLAALSSRGKQIIVQDSDHGIPDRAPEAVVDAVREVVAAARSAQ